MRPVENRNREEFDSCLPLIQRLLHCARAVKSSLAQATDKAGLNDVQFMLLWLCERHAHAGLSQRHLAQNLSRSPAQISGLVEDLRQQGLIVAYRPPKDRRRQVWRLTQDGQTSLDAACAELRSWTDRIMDLVAGESDSFIDMLDRLIQATRIPDPADRPVSDALPTIRVAPAEQEKGAA